MDLMNIADDGYITNSSSVGAYKRLIDELRKQEISGPDGFMYTLKSEDGRSEYADFAWPDKNVLLFSLDRQACYEALLSAKNRFKCYLLTDSFDYVSFVKEVNG